MAREGQGNTWQVHMVHLGGIRGAWIWMLMGVHGMDMRWISGGYGVHMDIYWVDIEV